MLQSFKGRTVEANEKVAVFWNLHKDCFSIQGKTFEDNKKKTVTKVHADNILLMDVEFSVRESGRQKVLQEKKKNVHAFVKGKFGHAYDDRKTLEVTLLPTMREAYYNPYKTDSFVDKETGKKITKADYVVMIDKKVWYKVN